MPPHWVRALLAPAPAPRGPTGPEAALLLALACSPVACSRSSELRVTVDTAAAPEAKEVLALPFDPARLTSTGRPSAHPKAARRRPDATAADGGGPEIVARYAALADSADALDARFHSARAELNSRALAMRSQERRSYAYASAYDAFQRARDSSLRLRASRDRLRAQLSELRARYPEHLAGPLAGRYGAAATGAASALRSALDSAAAAAGRRIVRGRLEAGAATLRLPAGTWWIALAHADGLPRGARRRDVDGEGRETIRIP